MEINDSKEIKLIDVKTDNITDYKKTSLLFVFPFCSGKCGPECQNKYLRDFKPNSYKIKDILNLYKSLETHDACVFAGLEPFDSFDDCISLSCLLLLQKKPVDIVIYTGYKMQEIKYIAFITRIKDFISDNYPYINKKSCIIIKSGRYKANLKHKWKSSILGVELATENQKVQKLSFSLDEKDKIVYSLCEDVFKTIE